MQIHHEELGDVRRYIDNHKDITLEEKEPHFRNMLRAVQRYKTVDGNTRMLEVGTGTGWFPLLSQLNGIPCQGLEISPQLIACAHEIGARYGIRPDIKLGNLEDSDLSANYYDVVIASNVFEHIEDWKAGVHKIAEILKPGGLLYFESSNKWSPITGEYSGFPTYYCYGWLPDQWRYALRRWVHGPDIMKLGIDFHQFRHPQLRCEFERAGFRQIYDRVQIAHEDHVSTEFRRKIVRLSRKNGLVRWLALTFAEATRFICLK